MTKKTVAPTFDPNLKELVHPPIKAAQDILEHAQNAKVGAYGQGWPMPFPGLSDYFAPLTAGETCVVCAGSSEYKTSFMQAWIEANLASLQDDHYVIYFSTEETEEALTAYTASVRTRDPRDRIMSGRISDWFHFMSVVEDIKKLRIIRIADSLVHQTDGYERLTVTNMSRIVEVLQSGKTSLGEIKIAAVFFDYIQSFPQDNEVEINERSNFQRLKVKSDFYALRDIAKRCRIPCIIGSQAREDLKAPRWMYIPSLLENMESTDIGRRTDRQLSLWLPKQSISPGTFVEMGSKTKGFTCEEDLLFVRVAKQRGNLPAGKTWAYRIDYALNQLRLIPMSEVIQEST